MDTIPAPPVGETPEQWLARILRQRAARDARIASGRENPDWDEIRKIQIESADL